MPDSQENLASGLARKATGFGKGNIRWTLAGLFNVEAAE